MRLAPKFFIIIALVLVFLAACDDDKPQQITTQQAFAEYWQYESDLTGSLESRDGTMASLQAAILGLNTRSGKDAISEIENFADTYVTKSEQAGEYFETLASAENAIVPYGDDKGILGSIAKGIYNKAADTVVGAGHLVRSGVRVLTGRKSLRQVLNDPESGIPIVSSFAETMQKHNADRDLSIRTSILENNSQEGMIPLDQLPGTTVQDKLNSYMNLSDEDPLKMNIRRDVMYWDEAERARTAATAKELGETGVKIVGDAYGGDVGEWTNEVLLQHMSEGQTSASAGTVNHTINQSGTGNPPITTGKTMIISKRNMPDSDPRITVIMNAPQALTQPLPAGGYDIIAVADGFIRDVKENLQVVQGQVQSAMASLLKLSENQIVIQGLTVDEGSITVGQVIHAHVSCVSTMGRNLSFNWTITGGTYTNLVQNGVDMSFKPTEEKEYTIQVTITDSAGITKSQSIVVTSLGGRLVIDSWQIVSESFTDTKLNPGESATLNLAITNTSTVTMTGTQSATGLGGITTNMTAGAVVFTPNETKQVNIPIVIPADFSAAEGEIQYNFLTVNQSQIPVQIFLRQAFPVDFYVLIDEVDSPVTDRVLEISGKVANPQLQTALMILDNDPDQTFDLNLDNGEFYQDIALTGTDEEVSHVVKVIAVSGALTEYDTMNFTSHVPPVALRATLTWDTDGTDVDFWITDPNGEKCYYANSETASGLTLDFDDTNGYGPENITTTNIIPGDYFVQVHYYSDHNTSIAIPSNCVVVIRKDENSNQNPVTYYGSLGDTGDIWNVTTLHYDAAKGWSIKALNTHSKIDPRTLPQK